MRKPIAKHQSRHRTYMLMCPLAPRLAPRFTVCHAFPSYGERPE
jgi:hypothetical protein